VALSTSVTLVVVAKRAGRPSFIDGNPASLWRPILWTMVSRPHGKPGCGPADRGAGLALATGTEFRRCRSRDAGPADRRSFGLSGRGLAAFGSTSSVSPCRLYIGESGAFWGRFDDFGSPSAEDLLTLLASLDIGGCETQMVELARRLPKDDSASILSC